MSQVRLNVKAEAGCECFINFPQRKRKLEVLLEMSERAECQLSPADPPPVEKTKNSKKKKDSTNSLPPLKYSLIDDMKLQITRWGCRA